MNIKQAKEYIKNSINLYLKKDEFGEYKVPVVRQRPIFLLGAPGIGKTAIMEQIAQELGIALVSYSMTHHTRQSALGLPFITKKSYGGEEYSVSEYTMSEIIASVYETMEKSGVKEGILFLDEINCVSETLAPSMLQFLQYKVFGRHQVPEGWVVVTAGNPPEYNKSVREFDVVTMDRLKLLEVLPDYNIWREYAVDRHVHSAVLNYLDLKKDHFYVMEMTTKGRSYVTARGWEDLSEMLCLYEEDQIKVEESLIGQYLRNETVIKEFAAYYDLYVKYKKDYQISDILEGNCSPATIARAKSAPFDERLSLLGLLLDRVMLGMSQVMEQADYFKDLQPLLAAIRDGQGAEKPLPAGISEEQRSSADLVMAWLKQFVKAKQKQLKAMETAGSVSDTDRRKHKRVILFLQDMNHVVLAGDAKDADAAFALVKQNYMTRLEKMKHQVSVVGAELHNLFAFAEEAFEGGNEMLLLVTQLTVGKDSARFIGTFGSEDYQKHNEALMITERSADLKAQIQDLGI